MALSIPARALAQDLPPVAYEAPASCPDAAAFAARLRALAGTSPIPPPSATYEAHVSEEHGFVAELRIHEAGGTTTSRKVSGASCDETFDALAFVTMLAMGLEPGAASGTPPPPAPPAVALPDAPRPPVVPRPPSTFELALGVDAVALGMVGPTVQPTASPFVSVLREGTGTWSPELRMAFERASGSAVNPAGHATLTRTSGRVDLCPLALELLGGLRALPCAGLDLGVLSGTGSGPGIASKSDQSGPWVAVDLGARLGYRFWRRFELELGALLQVPLTREELYFGPVSEVYGVPAVGGLVLAGVAFTLL